MEKLGGSRKSGIIYRVADKKRLIDDFLLCGKELLKNGIFPVPFHDFSSKAKGKVEGKAGMRKYLLLCFSKIELKEFNKFSPVCEVGFLDDSPQNGLIVGGHVFLSEKKK
jgi:hypothetical protein